MSKQDEVALRLWADTTSAPLAQGIIIEFTHRLRAVQTKERLI